MVGIRHLLSNLATKQAEEIALPGRVGAEQDAERRQSYLDVVQRFVTLDVNSFEHQLLQIGRDKNSECVNQYAAFRFRKKFAASQARPLNEVQQFAVVLLAGFGIYRPHGRREGLVLVGIKFDDLAPGGLNGRSRLFFLLNVKLALERDRVFSRALDSGAQIFGPAFE
jgi:hypothetical protein